MKMMEVIEINIYQHLIFMYRFYKNLLLTNFNNNFETNINEKYHLSSNVNNTFKFPRKCNKLSECKKAYRGPKIRNAHVKKN